MEMRELGVQWKWHWEELKMTSDKAKMANYVEIWKRSFWIPLKRPYAAEEMLAEMSVEWKAMKETL